MAALPLLALRTDGLSWFYGEEENGDAEQLPDAPAPSDEERQEMDGQVREMTEQQKKDAYIARFGHHEPLKSKLEGVICRGAREDMKMLALSLWTGEYTFRLISAFKTFIAGRTLPGCDTLELFCERLVNQAAPRSALAVLVLFFAPANDFQQILGNDASDFLKLGCTFSASRARCDFQCSLVDSIHRQRKQKPLPATLDDAVSEVEIQMGLRLKADHGESYKEGMALKDVLMKLAGHGMVEGSGQLKNERWPQGDPDPGRYDQWLNEVRRVYREDASGSDLPAKLLDAFQRAMQGKRILYEGQPALTVIRNAAGLYQSKYINKAGDFFNSARENPDNKNKVTTLLINATEVVSGWLETLWVETMDAAGPVFRGDITPSSWLDRPNDEPVRFPVATSFSSIQAYAFFNQAKDMQVDEAKASVKQARDSGSMSQEQFDAYVKERTPKEEDSLFAILCAKGTRNIDINGRLSGEEVNSGGYWLDCHLREKEVLIHPETVFRSVVDEYGKQIRVSDLNENLITDAEPKPHWVKAIEKELSRHGIQLPSPESLLAFQRKLARRPGKLASAFGMSASENKRIVVAFPDPDASTDSAASNKRGARLAGRGRPKRTRGHWTDFSALRQLVQT